VSAVPDRALAQRLRRARPQGLIKTGPDLSSEELTGAHWPLSRRPYLLETSLPGVVAAGMFVQAMSNA
jgi:thioredoxin reductase (NADPH)